MTSPAMISRPECSSAASIDAHHPDHDNANKLCAGFTVLLAQRGIDRAYGRKLPRLLAEQGLADVAADAYMPVSLLAAGALHLSNFDQLHDVLLAQGLATAEEIDRHRAAVDRGTGFVSPPLIAAWGRKPPVPQDKAPRRPRCWLGSLRCRRNLLQPDLSAGPPVSVQITWLCTGPSHRQPEASPMRIRRISRVEGSRSCHRRWRNTRRYGALCSTAKATPSPVVMKRIRGVLCPDGVDGARREGVTDVDNLRAGREVEYLA